MAITHSHQGQHEALPEFVRQKLIAFGTIEQEFVESFQYKEAVHGQRRFDSLPIAATVRYLHALWTCDRKDALLSVPHTSPRFEGQRCLELLREWQAPDGSSVGVVEFLHRKLDMLEFADLTRQMEEAQRGGKRDVAERLSHGRNILLNRNFNLSRALDAIFALASGDLRAHVAAACARYEHTPEQIERQLAEMRSPLYSWASHPVLARRNMEVMNHVGMVVTDNMADRPGSRTRRVITATSPQPAYAEQPIAGEITFASMAHNNPAGRWIATVPLAADAPTISEASQQA